MPKLNGKHPRYRLHKASGRATVTLAGKNHYVGTFGTTESRKRYDTVIGEWLAAGRPSYRHVTAEGSDSILIIPLVAEFLR